MSNDDGFRSEVIIAFSEALQPRRIEVNAKSYFKSFGRFIFNLFFSYFFRDCLMLIHLEV
jgi:hypothetical protein